MIIFFCRSWRKPKPGTARRHWRYYRGVTASRWISSLTHSKLAHCAIGDARWILDTTVRGCFLYDFAEWVDGHPTLDGWIEIAPLYDANLGKYAFGARFGGTYELQLIGRWLTRGVIPCNDCVSVTRDVLRNSGLRTPRRIVSPAALRRWLIDQGFDYTAAGPPADTDPSHD